MFFLNCNFVFLCDYFVYFVVKKNKPRMDTKDFTKDHKDLSRNHATTQPLIHFTH